MIQYKVLKAFPFSKDGIKVEHADAGSSVELPVQLVQGLVAAGYVTVIKDKTQDATVEVPSIGEPANTLETKIIEAAPETKPAWLK